MIQKINKFDRQKKNFIWNMIGSTLNAFNSLLFLIVVTHINGIDDAGIFSFAFSTALMFSYIGIYCGRVYQVADSSPITNREYIVSRYITCFAMIVSAIIFTLCRGYSIYKIIIMLSMFIFKMIEAYFDCIYAIYQENDSLYQVGISETLKSLIGISCFLIMDLITNNIIYSIIILIIVNIIIFILYDFKRFRLYVDFKEKVNINNVKQIFIKGFAPFLLTFLTLYLINSAKYVIDSTCDNAIQTVYGIILMPGTVIQLLVGFIIQPYILKLRNLYDSKKYKDIDRIIKKFSLITLGICALIIIFGYLIGIPVLSFIYAIDLSSYRLDFIILLVGSSFYAIVTILSSVFITIHENNIQVILFVIISIFSYFCSHLLVTNYNILGACISYLCSMIILFVLFISIKIVIFKKLYKKAN